MTDPKAAPADPKDGSSGQASAWSGRFAEPVSERVARFQASVGFDRRLAEADIDGSLAHARMLTRVGVLSSGELAAIERGINDGTLYFSSLNSKEPVTLDGSEGEYHSKIYVASRTPQGDFANSTALEEAINRVDFYNSGVSFSEDGSRMYFTRENISITVYLVHKYIYQREKAINGARLIQ